MKKIVLRFLLLMMINMVFASPPISLNLQNVNLQDALRILAKQLQQDIVISPAVNGVISLNLHHMTAHQAFDFILQSKGLVQYNKNNLWFIMPQKELISQKQDEIKLQEMLIESAPLISRIFKIRYATADEIARLVQDNSHSLLSKRGMMHVDLRTNQIYLQDIEKNVAIIHDLIRHVDIPVQQVLIETRLASVDNDFERQLGIHFSTTASLSLTRLSDGAALDVELAALENAGHGELISSPSLFTANQQTASIESGEEIPYQEISRSGATGVAFKKAVLSLKVTPQILPNNKVLLALQVNQDRPSTRIVQGVPAITTRQISTHILVRNGQTIVLGGIFESNKNHTSEGIPFMNKIPVVGLLFQQHDWLENKRELLIFVTPKIIT